MNTTDIRLVLIPCDDTTADELSSETIDVRRQLLDAPVSDVALVRDFEAPEGAKALDALTLGELLITAAPSTALVGAIASIARAKIKAQTLKKVTLTIAESTLELTGQSRAEQEALVKSWLSRLPSQKDSDG